MRKRSAGLLMWRRGSGGVQVFLVHPGGPMWAKKDAGAWTIPKGEYVAGEGPLEAARREFGEETGFGCEGPFVPLGEVRQKSGKMVTAWAFEGDCVASELTSNSCEIEWPPRSGRRMQIPEVDRGEWFGLGEARGRVREEQRAFLDALQAGLNCASAERVGGA